MNPFYISDWKDDFFKKIHAFVKKNTNNTFKDAVMIFPTMRSKKIALDYFVDQEQSAFLPEMLTVPEWLAFCQEAWLDKKILKARRLDNLENIALLYEIVCELAREEHSKGQNEFGLYAHMLSYQHEKKTTHKELNSFKHFYSYGQYLHKIILECFDGNNKALSIPYNADEVSEFASYLLNNLREIVQKYQEKLIANEFTTKEHLKFCLAQTVEKGEDALLPIYQNKRLFFCGLDQISGTEEVCMKYFYDNNAYFLFSTDSNLCTDIQNAHWSSTFYREWAQKWNTKFALLDNDTIPKEETNFFFHQAFDTHSQFQNFEIIPKVLETEKTACVMNSEQSLSPMINILNKQLTDEQLNITMGYSLRESKIYQLLYLFDITRQNSRNFKVKVKAESDKKPKVSHEEKIYIRQSDFYQYLSFSFLDSSDFQTNKLTSLLQKVKQHIKEAPYICISDDLFSDTEIYEEMQCFFSILSLWLNMYSLSSTIDFIKALEKQLAPQLHTNSFERLALKRLVNRAFELQEKEKILHENLGYEICSSLILDFLSSSSVAYEHHSDKALQVLGLRETKLLSFDTVYIFDANDDILPPRMEENPLLPEKLRTLIGLKSLRANEVYSAHTWYRLLAASKTVHIHWQESNAKSLFDDKKIPSPYVEEALWTVEQRKNKILKSDDKEFTQARCIIELSQYSHSVEVNAELRNAINELFKKPFSPTRLDTFLACPLKFMYQNILKLHEPSEIKEEESPVLLGNLVHKFMENLYPKLNKKVHRNEVEEVFKKEILNLDKYLHDENLYDILPAESMFLLKNSFPYRLKKYIANHPEVTKIIAIEKDLSASLSNTQHGRTYNFYGQIDRIDERLFDGKEEIILLDYKTGSVDNKIHPTKFWNNEEYFISLSQNLSKFNEGDAQNILNHTYKSSKSLQMPIYLFLTHFNNYSINNAAFIDFYDKCEEKMVLAQECNKAAVLDDKIPLLLNFIVHYLENITVFSKTEHSPCGWCSYSRYCQ